MPHKKKYSLFIISAFIVSILYWIYLSFICQMFIWHDARGYRYLGELIYHQGWIAYFKTGPHREPIYPGLVAISMFIADKLSTSYKTVQMFLQILLLFLTQFLTYIILKKLNIRPRLSGLVLLYLGFSPIMFIMSFRLYSEIAVLPFVLLIILANLKACQSIHQDARESTSFISGLGLGLSFLGATFVKGIFQIIIPLFLLPYCILMIFSFKKKYISLRKKTAVFLLGILLSFYLPLNIYKLMNKTHNGVFTLTDRGAWALYGNTVRRMEPLNIKRFLMAITYIPRPESCYNLFGKEACQFWHYSESDKFGLKKLHQLRDQGLSSQQIDQQLIRLSIAKALHNPLQYALFWILEGAKFLFWELRSMAYVVYPTWMIQLFSWKPFSLGLNGVMALLSFIGLVYLAQYCWRHKNDIIPIFLPHSCAQKTSFSLDKRSDSHTIIITSIFMLITAYIMAHCFFFVLPRYVFPIVPLYLISIAVFIQHKNYD